MPGMVVPGQPEYTPKPGDPDFKDLWNTMPDTTEAEKLVKKLALSDKRKLMVAEGLFVAEKSNEPYDQFKVVERSEKMKTALNMPKEEVHRLAVEAMQKHLARGERNLTSIGKSC